MVTLGLKQKEDPLATQTTQTAWPVTNFTQCVFGSTTT